MLGLNKRMVKECLSGYIRSKRLRQDVSRDELAKAAVDNMTMPVKVMMKIRKKIFEVGTKTGKGRTSAEVTVFKKK